MLPNLFHYAPSELSQDAFLSWFLSWAKDSYKDSHPHLNQIARELICSIHERAKLPIPKTLSNIEIRKQYCNIDILCTINDDTFILIETKIGTKQHSNQLARYKQSLQAEGFPSKKLILVYVQIGDQSNYDEVDHQGYLTMRRRDILDILESDTGKLASSKSDILCDYSLFLRQKEDAICSYLSLAPNEWTSDSWKGFFLELQETLEGDWNYVPNQAGGFMGFWWHSKAFNDGSDGSVYLQLEQEKLCFKIAVNQPGDRRRLRQLWSDLIISQATECLLNIKRPHRFGNGRHMTVAILDNDYRQLDGNGVLDLNSTTKVLRSAETVIDACITSRRT